jgi:hypothetical protein
VDAAGLELELEDAVLDPRDAVGVLPLVVAALLAAAAAAGSVSWLLSSIVASLRGVIDWFLGLPDWCGLEEDQGRWRWRRGGQKDGFVGF